MPTYVTDDLVYVRMQTPGYGDVCWVCDGEASGFHGVPVFNGDLMSNDWPGEWGGVPACESCYTKHERDELRTWDAEYQHVLLVHHGFDGSGI